MHPVEENIQTLGAALRQAGALSAVLKYEGGGDSGEVSEHYIVWPDNKEGVVGKLTYKNWSFFYEYAGHDQEPDAVDVDFETALTDIAFQVVEISGHAGWENNAGGSGTFIVKENGSAMLNHAHNEDRTDNSEIEFSNEHRVFPYTKLLAEYLKGAGALSLTAYYDGSGGSREEYHIAVEWPDYQSGDIGDVTIPATELHPERILGFNEAVCEVLWLAVKEAGYDRLADEDQSGAYHRGQMTITESGIAKIEHYASLLEEGDSTVSTYGDFGDDAVDEIEY